MWKKLVAPLACVVGFLMLANTSAKTLTNAADLVADNTPDGTYIVQGTVTPQQQDTSLGVSTSYNLVIQTASGVQTLSAGCSARKCDGTGLVKVQKSKQDQGLNIQEIKPQVIKMGLKPIVSYMIPIDGDLTVTYMEPEGQVVAVSVPSAATNVYTLKSLFNKYGGTYTGAVQGYSYDVGNARIVNDDSKW